MKLTLIAIAVFAISALPVRAQGPAAKHGAPGDLKPNETYKVSFPIFGAAASGKDRWARVGVVFGEGTRAVADFYPSDDIRAFDFPEKAFATVKRK